MLNTDTSFGGKVCYFEDFGDAFGVALGATTVDFFFLATEAFGLADAFMFEDMVGFGAANEPVAAIAALRPVVSAISETAAPAMIRRFDDSLNVT